MKALSIKQPWAWLIVNGFKTIENRTRRTHFRGPFLVHASSRMTRDDHEACLLFCRSNELLGQVVNNRRLIIPAFGELPTGGIVGRAEIVDCVQKSSSKWFCGDYGYVLKGAKPLTFVSIIGQLNFFNLCGCCYCRIEKDATSCESCGATDFEP